MRNCEYQNSLLLFCTLQVCSVTKFNLEISVVALGSFLFLPFCLSSFKKYQNKFGQDPSSGWTNEQIFCHQNFQIRDLNMCVGGLRPS